MPENKKTSHEEHTSVFDGLSEKKAKNPGEKKKKKVLIACAILTVIVIVGLGLYYYFQYQHQQMLIKNPLLASEMIQETVVNKVGKLTQLPTNEHPAIATVTDITKLKNQPFFQNAKNGDFVLLYNINKRIILYDPTANKVIESEYFQTPLPKPQNSSNLPGQPITVAIYNGTTTAGLAKKTQSFLQQRIKNIDIVSESNAAKQTYTQTLVVDLTGNNSVVQSQLASLLGATAAPLPSGEAKPTNAVILVILGSKQQ